VTALILVGCGGRMFELPAIGTDSGDESTQEATSDALLDAIGTDAGDESAMDAGGDSLLDAPDEDGMVSLDCPPAAAVQGGAACSVALGMICTGARSVPDCAGNVTHDACICQANVWLCKGAVVVPCPPPPSTTCPAPADIMGGKACTGIKSGLTCRGNPTMCNGATFYDALQCDGTTWITLAATVCGIDGG
jgi:hypothetical protein